MSKSWQPEAAKAAAKCITCEMSRQARVIRSNRGRKGWSKQKERVVRNASYTYTYARAGTPYVPRWAPQDPPSFDTSAGDGMLFDANL